MWYYRSAGLFCPLGKAIFSLLLQHGTGKLKIRREKICFFLLFFFPLERKIPAIRIFFSLISFNSWGVTYIALFATWCYRIRLDNLFTSNPFKFQSVYCYRLRQRKRFYKLSTQWLKQTIHKKQLLSEDFDSCPTAASFASEIPTSKIGLCAWLHFPRMTSV